MSPSLPRLYRSLEKRSDQPEIDRVVSAAVATFLSVSKPSQRHDAELARLIASSWESLTATSREEVRTTLGGCAFLSPSLDALLASLKPSAVAGRGDTARPSSSPAEKPATTASDRPAGMNAEETRQALRRMVRPGSGLRPAGEPSARPKQRSIADLLQFVQSSRNAETAYEAIADFVGLAPSHADAMECDDSGMALAKAMKAARIGTPEAMAILTHLKPSVAFSADALTAMKASYQDMEADSLRGELGLISVMPAIHAAPAPKSKLKSPHADIARETRGGEARKTFGRRLAAPAVKGTVGLA